MEETLELEEIVGLEETSDWEETSEVEETSEAEEMSLLDEAIAEAPGLTQPLNKKAETRSESERTLFLFIADYDTKFLSHFLEEEAMKMAGRSSPKRKIWGFCKGYWIYKSEKVPSDGGCREKGMEIFFAMGSKALKGNSLRNGKLF